MKKSNHLNKIQWQDLRHLTAHEKAYNILLPYPFLGLSWYFAYQEIYLIAVIFSYFFTITAYRQGHDLYHHALGVSRHSSTLLLFIISLLSFTSLHSMKYSHLLHHREPLSDNDTEGYLAHKNWLMALFGGLLFRIRLFKHGFNLAPKREKRKIILESTLILLLTIAIFYYQYSVFIYQFVVMFIMNACAGLIAVWGLHHDCDEVGRTERNPIVNALSFNLFYHAEHHLFPAVPMQNLPKLAKRLDKVAPHLANNRVIPFLANKNNENCPIKGLFA